MDTVGDAYVVVGFLRDSDAPRDQGGAGGQGTGGHCFVPIGGHGEASGDVGGEGCARADARADAAASAVCGDVLAAARAMILALRDYRRRTGSDLHCRVGLALGDVVAGVLGHLQPRCAQWVGTHQGEGKNRRPSGD
jgi:class 3 adenylate cyclase